MFFAQAAGEHVVARTEASDGEEPDVFMQAALPLIASLPLELFECVCYSCNPPPWPEEDGEVDHINEDCTDDRLCNLQWVRTKNVPPSAYNPSASNEHKLKETWNPGKSARVRGVRP